MPRILLIDSDRTLLEKNAIYFQTQGLETNCAYTKYDAMQRLLTFLPDALLLEYRLPDGCGLDLCRKIRAYSPIPILFLTCVTSEENAVQALRCGADDYIRKPCSPRELYHLIVRRLRTRPKDHSTAKDTLTFNCLTIQFKNRMVCVNGAAVDLTPIEFDLLLLLAENLNQTVSQASFYRNCWMSEELKETSYALRAHISNLRKKLNFQQNANIQITNLYGKGYRLQLSPAETKSDAGKESLT